MNGALLRCIKPTCPRVYAGRRYRLDACRYHFETGFSK
jgi:hypothetical protein